MIIIQSAFDSKREAKKIATRLLEKGLIACAQITKIESNYIWENEMQEAKEYLLTCKLCNKNAKKVIKFITKNHTYDTPEIISIKPKYISKKYKKWVKKCSKY